MAYNHKLLKTFKWLDHIANEYPTYCKGFVPSSFMGIYTIYGSLYATNGVILAKIDYPEYQHISDDGWMEVVEYVSSDGFVLQYPELEPWECKTPLRDDYFEEFFAWMDVNDFSETFPFNPKVMKDALKPFEINGISPYISINREKFMLSGHNREVSIRVLFMGVRK